MRIDHEMDLIQLAALMGSDTPETEARHMRAALAGIGAWCRTEDVPDAFWLDLADAAHTRALRDEFQSGQAKEG